ncbi:hypothetical protein [Phytopseudomonas dryadis]|uniref:Uncharacterized protein n=1 Tax=Phytopseudomonas dryadis TaxID=2487520 RepID=A0A4Q9R3V9_9GAMM|nr:hypothetical protein [Pseudomonas dryadis]TBU94669.1 hypothetical protein DNK44_08215 [Pseudomonas dryadis]
MTSYRLGIVSLTVFALFSFIDRGMAYDMNTLDRHLDTQRWNRLQDHQNSQRTKPAPRKNTPTNRKASKPACSADSMPPAERRRMEAQARRIMQREGQAAAVAYARKQGMAYHQKLKKQGICP